MTRRAQFAPLSLTLLLAASASVPHSAAAQTAKKTSVAKKAPHISVTEQLVNDAGQAFDRQDFAAAADLYTKFLADHPDEAFAHFQLAYCDTALKRRDEAIAEYRKAIALDPKMGAGYLNLGLLLVEKDPAGAAPLLEKAVELMPGKAEPHYLAGTALERSGNATSAIAHYREAAKFDESKWEYRIALARALLVTKRVAEAEPEFRKSLELRADYAPARLGLAQCLIAEQKLPEAAEALHSYLESAPNDAETRLQLAAVYADLSRYDEAMKELDALAAGAAPSPETDRIRVDVLLRSKRYGEAVEPLRRLVASTPSDATLHARLGRVLMQKRDFPAAQQELVSALRLDPKLTDALRDLSSTYVLADNYPATLAALDELAKREEPGAGQWFIRALCYDKMHVLKEALAAYQKFLALDQGKDPDQSFQARQRSRILKLELDKR